MSLKGFRGARYTGAEGFFLGHPGLALEWTNVWVGEFLQVVDKGEGVPERAAKDDLRGGELTVRIRRVAKL